MKRSSWIVPAVVGGAIAVYFAKKKGSDGETSGKSLDQLIDEAGRDQGFNRMIDDLSKSQPEVKAQLGTLLVTVTLKVSGGEKTALSWGLGGGMKGLRNDGLAFAKAIQQVLPSKCPGAPRLMSEPVLDIVDVPEGFKVVVKWVASWGHAVKGPVRSEVRACMEKVVRADPKIGPRVLGLTAVRV